MNITFMVGNGFDLRLGMKTKYTDVYKGYVEEDIYGMAFGNFFDSMRVIEKFKRELKRHEMNNYRNWSDFEMAMAEYASELETEDDFIKCVRDFKEYMAKHLKQEEEKIMLYLRTFKEWDDTCITEFQKSISEFYHGQIPNDKNKITEIFNSNPIKEYNFISFNYTTVLDYLFELYKNEFLIHGGKIVHVHGSLGGDVVLGVDNLEQFSDLKFKPTAKLKRAFVKPIFNADFDSERIEQAEKLISESDIICIYGMSLGESDRTWINCICKWLLESSNRHLIYFQYIEDKFSNLHGDRMMEEEEDRKQCLLEKMFQEESDRKTVFNQVHIPIGYDIFDFINKLEENSQVLEISAQV